jgi:glutaminyl-tRNA synthetase
VETNLSLFRDMRAGKFPNGACVLRAKIDLASGNMNLRDPVLYRILHAPHPRIGAQWCIYPTYDFAHGQSDAVEHVTHSLCTLELRTTVLSTTGSSTTCRSRRERSHPPATTHAHA